MTPITVAGTFNPGNPAYRTYPAYFHVTFPSDVGFCEAMLVISSPTSSLIGPAGDEIPFLFDQLREATGTTSSSYIISSFGGRSDIYDTLRIFPTANISGGIHSQTLTLSLYENSVLLARSAMTISINVYPACTLPAPDVASMDFSRGISGATILHGYTQSAVIQGASCTGAGRLTIRSAPLSTNAVPSPGFSSNINFNATARMGAASAQLSTAAATDASITVAGNQAPITIDVSLQSDGLPLVAGQYASTLRITLEPAN